MAPQWDTHGCNESSHAGAEVNASPSLSTDTPGDRRLKFDMIDDVLDLVDLEGRRCGEPPATWGG